MTKILFIPIDNRPVCYDLPIMISKIDFDNEIIMPDLALLGDLTKKANVDGIFDWLKNVGNYDVAVISLDTVAYGGLIASRRCDDKIENIKERTDKLFSLLKKSKAKVYAFSSIMRISNNNINEEEKFYWKDYGTKIFKYSFLKSKGENYSEAEKEIPKEILDDYLKTRNRNFEMNEYYIELKKQGFIDTLVFSKDDCARFGLNVDEANMLENLSKNLSNVFVKTGADEIPVSLLSRALNYDKRTKISVLYTNPDDIGKISKYEDISVQKSVNSQIDLCGGIVSDMDNSDLVLVVNNFKNEQGELVMNVFEPLFFGDFDFPEKPYFVADILNANGADNNFVDLFFEKYNPDNFYGYSAWNTTGNTLGNGISTALTYFNAKNKNKPEFEKLQTVRFLDDWAYQANVRTKIRDCVENLSSAIVKREMSAFENIVLNKFNQNNRNIVYSFPWNRFFEIRVDVT